MDDHYLLPDLSGEAGGEVFDVIDSAKDDRIVEVGVVERGGA